MPQRRKHDSNALRQAAYRKRRATAYEEQLRAKGLPALPVLARIPGRVRWTSAVESACALLEQTVTEMRSYYDDRSEPWQVSPRGEDHQERIDSLEAILDALGEWIP